MLTDSKHSPTVFWTEEQVGSPLSVFLKKYFLGKTSFILGHYSEGEIYILLRHMAYNISQCNITAK